MALGLRPSLAQAIQPRQRFARERSPEAGEERRSDGQLGARPVRRRFRQPQFDVEAGLDELPGGELRRPDVEEDERPCDVRAPAPGIRRAAEALDAPPPPRREAPPGWLDAVEA